jgi:transaldolase
LGQRLWLDDLTRELLQSGTLARYIRDFGISGLTSNPSTFDHAVGNTTSYDDSIRSLSAEGLTGADRFFALALEDVTRAADLFRPIFDATDGLDGWASLEVSPLLADDAAGTVRQVRDLARRGGRPNLYLKIPGTKAGLVAIEEAIAAGLPVNVTLLFSREQYLAAARAWQRGIERRIDAGLPPAVSSVASLFVSRWDKAVMDRVPADLRNRLGIAVAKLTYRAYRELVESSEWKRLEAAGVRPQRLLFASTGTKDPSVRDTLYVEALAAPDTINTIPDATLKAAADHGVIKDVLPRDGGDGERTLQAFRRAGVEPAELAETLQRDGARAFVESWNHLLGQIAARADLVSQAR